MTRKAMTPARKKRITERDGDACRECGNPGKHVDHIIPLWLQEWAPRDVDGVQRDLEADDNLQILCTACHEKKTSKEAGSRAKSKRLEKQRKGEPKTKAKATKRPIPSRGFDKTRTRGFDGKVKRR